MKQILLGLLLLTAAVCIGQQSNAGPIHANNVLAFIQPALAGPNVDDRNYWQPQWILWPPQLKAGDGGQLRSVATGADWVGDPAGFDFEPVNSGRAWKSRNFEARVARGEFIVRRLLLGNVATDLLVSSTGSTSPTALRVALRALSPIVPAYRMDSVAFPPGSLMVTEASGWDEIRRIELHTLGRVLVVEYPPRPDVSWTRYWLRGHGWSIRGTHLEASPDAAVVPSEPGLRVPGLIRARDVIPLLTHPEAFRADRVTQKSWPGANRFFDDYHAADAWVGLLWFVSIAAVVIWGAALVTHERESQIAPIFIAGALLSPAFVDLAGWLGRILGVDQWPIWLGVASFVLMLLSASLGALQRRILPRAHPLLATWIVGLLTLCFVDPVWGFMSPLFVGRPLPVSPISIAALFAYLTGAVSALRGSGTIPSWCGRGLCVLVLAGGVATRSWWTGDLVATFALPLTAWVIGEGRFRWPMAVMLVFWPTSLIPLMVGGVVWAPLGLLRNGHDFAGLNLAEYVDFLTSVGFWTFILVAGAISIFGYRFFFHQLRQLAKMDLRREATALATVAGVALGLLHPVMLSASLVLATGSACALLFDAVQTM